MHAVAAHVRTGESTKPLHGLPMASGVCHFRWQLCCHCTGDNSSPCKGCKVTSLITLLQITENDGSMHRQVHLGLHSALPCDFVEDAHRK